MINLQKGGNLSLSKVSTSTTFRVGLGWDKNTDSTIKEDIDIDVFGLIVDENNKNVVDSEIRFYNNIDGNNLKSADFYGSLSVEESYKESLKLSEKSVVVCSKDNLTGMGDGDDETLFFNSLLLPADRKVVIAINIYEAKTRKQLFGMVKNAYCSVYDMSGNIIVKYDLGEDFSIETGIIVGEFYHKDSEIKFKALGSGFDGDLNNLVSKFK
jgi:tellurium resistance protein TerD